jgi:hypothetical protein
MRTTLLFFAMCMGLLIAQPGRAALRNYAIVIGNNAAPSEGDAASLPTLHYADDDAVRFFLFAQRLGGKAKLLAVLDTETQRRYPGLAAQTEPPDTTHLDTVVQTLSAEMQSDLDAGDQVVLFFFFSGHGAIGDDGKAFLVLRDRGLSREELYQNVVAQLPTTYTHLFVDACHAGAVVGARGMFSHELDATHAPVSDAEAKAASDTDPRERFPGLGFLVATTQGQEAHEWSRYQAGVFTHELLSGLTGAADINQDGKIEYSEVQAFVAAANREVRDPRALPQVVARPPTRNQNAVIVELQSLQNTVLLSGDPSSLGRFHIELDDGQRYLDAHLGTTLARLALPAQRRMFVRTDTAEAELATRAGKRIELSSLTFKPQSVKARGSLDTAFREALFIAPFSASYYKGYVDSTGAVAVHFSSQDSLDPNAASSASGNLYLGIGLASLSGVMAVLAVASTVGATVAYMDYSQTDLQKPAYEANQRFVLFEFGVIATAVISAAAGAAAWWQWPIETVEE